MVDEFDSIVLHIGLDFDSYIVKILCVFVLWYCWHIIPMHRRGFYFYWFQWLILYISVLFFILTLYCYQEDTAYADICMTVCISKFSVVALRYCRFYSGIPHISSCSLCISCNGHCISMVDFLLILCLCLMTGGHVYYFAPGIFGEGRILLDGLV